MASVDKVIEKILTGALLASQGRALSARVWESAVYLGKDGFVYCLEATRKDKDIKVRVIRKNDVGEYLRWVDDLFDERFGNFASEGQVVHYRAAEELRDLL